MRYLDEVYEPISQEDWERGAARPRWTTCRRNGATSLSVSTAVGSQPISESSGFGSTA
jgi:hypothetical protein